MRITKEQLETLQKRFQAFLKGETTIAADEAFQNAVQSYTEVSACIHYDDLFRARIILSTD